MIRVFIAFSLAWLGMTALAVYLDMWPAGLLGIVALIKASDAYAEIELE